MEAERTMENIGKQYPYVSAYYKNRKFASSIGTRQGSELEREMKMYELQNNPNDYIKKKMESKMEGMKNKMEYQRLKRK